jgi:hypothetical protein
MTKFQPQLCAYADFESLLPIPISRDKIIQMSKSGNFPPFIRPANQKSEPVFRKEDILDWIRHTYSDFLPACVAEVEKSDFARIASTPRGRSKSNENV